MAAARTRVVGIEATVFNLRQLADTAVRDAAGKAMAKAGEVAKAAAYANLTRSDHSLAQLRAMDHPYAKRHGSIGVHAGEEHVVHTRTGRMAAALQGEVKFRAGGSGGSRPYYLLGWWGGGVPPHVKWVVEGTRVMLPRDVLWATVSAPHVRPAMLRAFVQVMGAELRTRAGIRFGSGGP
jgi:hypothetical protein